jgi:hypothetical protein
MRRRNRLFQYDPRMENETSEKSAGQMPPMPAAEAFAPATN